MNLVYLLFTNALILGIRHGIDWDHIAAIMDIVGTVTTAQSGTNGGVIARQRSTVLLSSMYALGHALVVVILGLSALMFATVMPEWIGPIMERVVGVTLIIFGLYVIFSLFNFMRGKEQFHLQSRWIILAGVVAKLNNWVRLRFLKLEEKPVFALQKYGRRTAFGVGMLHGIGAETGTQVLLMASVAGQANRYMAFGMLASFVIGFALSNTLVALLGASGMIFSEGTKWLYVSAACLTGIFSLIIGFCFTFGLSENLPDLQHLLPGGV
jgi:cytochrome c biogenesis protein CcdA